MSEQTKAWIEGGVWAAVSGAAWALQSGPPINWKAVALAALFALGAFLRNNVKALPPVPPTDPTKQA